MHPIAYIGSARRFFSDLGQNRLNCHTAASPCNRPSLCWKRRDLEILMIILVLAPQPQSALLEGRSFISDQITKLTSEMLGKH